MKKRRKKEDNDQDQKSGLNANAGADNPLLENLKSSLSNISKIRNQMQNKAKEDEEMKSSRDVSRSSSIDRLNTSIKVQLKLASGENTSESGDDRSIDDRGVDGGERIGELFDKRRTSEEMTADLETFGNDPQKKVKFG